MGKKTKIWLIVAAGLLLSGLILYFVFAGNVKMETNTHVVDGHYDSVVVNVDAADVTVLPSADGTCKVVCYETENLFHSVYTRDNALFVNTVDERLWFEHLLIGYEKPQITVYLPQKEYSMLLIEGSTGDVELREGLNFLEVNVSRSTGDVTCAGVAAYAMCLSTTTGEIHVENVLTEALELSVTTGNIRLTDIFCAKAIANVTTGQLIGQNIKCQNLISEGTTGDVLFNDLIADDKICINRSTGNVFLGSSDAVEIVIHTTTGDVDGVLLTEKVFVVSTKAGIVDVPESVSGGRCEVHTTTGDIGFTIYTPQ